MDDTAAAPEAPAPAKRPRRFGRWLLRRGAVVALLLIVARWTGVAESQMVYFPSRAPFTTPKTWEDVEIKTPDGLTLHGWFMPARGVAPGTKAPAILHVHGNAGNVSSHSAMSSFLADAGFHVLIFDYRGYGRSSPARWLNRDELMVDTVAAFDALKGDPRLDPDRIGVLGVSLGGTFALGLPSRRPSVKAVCTASAFSSWPGIAEDFVPVLGPVVMRSGLDGRNSVAAIGMSGSRMPMLFIHGDVDSIVPVRHAVVLANTATQAGAAGERTIVAGAKHNDLITDFADARIAIQGFFRANLFAPPAR